MKEHTGAANRVASACSYRIRVHSFVLFVLSHGNWVKNVRLLQRMLYVLTMCTVYAPFCSLWEFTFCLSPLASHCHRSVWTNCYTESERLIQNLHEWWKIANNISAVRLNYNDDPSPHSLIYDWSVRHQNRCFPIDFAFSVGGLIFSFFIFNWESVRQNSIKITTCENLCFRINEYFFNRNREEKNSDSIIHTGFFSNRQKI